MQHSHTSAVNVLHKRIGRFWAQKRNLEQLSTMVLDSLVERLTPMCRREICNELRTNPLMDFGTQAKALQRFGIQVQHSRTPAVNVLPKRIERFWAQKRNLERLFTMVLDSLVEWLVTMCCRKICS